MRRFPLGIVLCTLASFGTLGPACSSNGASGSGANGGDAGIPPNQIVGAPCDPTLSSPCLQGPRCFTVACDAKQEPPVCVEALLPGPCIADLDGSFAFEASVADGPVVSSGCSSNADCPSVSVDGSAPITFVCAFSAYDGCIATGACVSAAPPHRLDGAVETACGCDGEPVPYVTDTQTSAPVASPGPCAVDAGKPDSGSDAGADAADAGAADAGADAQTDGAAGEAGPDAADDANLDAPSDG